VARVKQIEASRHNNGPRGNFDGILRLTHLHLEVAHVAGQAQYFAFQHYLEARVAVHPLRQIAHQVRGRLEGGEGMRELRGVPA
jgi:hypothetical protein